MKPIISKLLCTLILATLSAAVCGCDSEFYLSESEAAAYTGLFINESGANNFISHSLPGQVLDIQFDNSSQPPTILSTNLTTLMRDYTVLGGVDAFNQQVQLERLDGELQKQIERWIRNKLRIYQGTNNAGVQLTQLTSVRIHFRNLPAFTFHPERQSIAFNLMVNLTINGTIRVDALDPLTNVIFGVNGDYPLLVSMNDLTLSGQAVFLNQFADAGEIGFGLTPQPGAITVTDTGSSSAPAVVKDGVRNFIRHQLSQPLHETFTQRYDYFSVAGLRLSQLDAQTASTLQYTYNAHRESARPLMHIIARGADGKLYDLRKTEGGIGLIDTVQPFPDLSVRIENEPAVFASAVDQLEVAATTIAGDLIYAHWRDEKWTNQTAFAPQNSSSTAGYTSKPALVASAPGQVEIIAVGRNGGLWHMRRVNGFWYAPAAISIPSISGFRTPPYRDPIAVLTGNKVVVVFVDGQSRLHAVPYDLESGIWGSATRIPTQEFIAYAPTAAASGDGRVEVVYAGSSGTPYHRVLLIDAARILTTSSSGLNIVGNETSVGGVVNASPVLVCSSHRQLELIGRGTDDHLYHNHFVGPSSTTGLVDGRRIAQGWQGWSDLNGNFSGTVTLSGGRMSTFAAAGTRTGKVVSVSVSQPNLLDNNPQQFLFYNTYDSQRFGTQPWKTVLWRGFEKAGRQRFVGQPALAVIDRNFAMAYVDNNLTFQRARVAENNRASFNGLDSSAHVSYTTPIDATMVSSVAGKSDTVFVGTDGLLRHIRKNEIGSGFTTVLAAPAGVTFVGQPAAVGYGNGQLEVVAVAQSGALYHWRFQNGTWTSFTQLNGQVLSQPILVHIGAGQLVTLAVGLDQRLYLWYFKNGAWASSRQISTGIVINQILFGPMAASSWGEGSIDLALVESQTGALYHGRLGGGTITGTTTLGMTPGRSFTSLGGVQIDTPVMTAVSETRGNILSVGTDNAIYSSWSSPDPSRPIFQATQAPPVVWVGFDYLGGENILLGGVAKTGANELTAVGIDRSGRLLLNRYRGVRWTQYQAVTGQNPQTQLSQPRYRPTVTIFGS